jgi:hypothetical protein
MKRFGFVMYIVFTSYACLGQIAPSKNDGITDPNELNLGVNFNTRGSVIGGFTMKYLKQIDVKKAHSFAFEIVNIKDPKEFRMGTRSNSTYIKGKNNHLLSLRSLYGKNFLLFNKAKDEGLEMLLNASGGLCLGFEKPYYVQIRTSSSVDSSGYFKYKDVKNDNNIANAANILMGLGESKIVPGASFRLSTILEFGFTKENTIGVEIGTQIDAYSRKINILNYTNDKNFVFTAFFVGYMGLRW